MDQGGGSETQVTDLGAWLKQETAKDPLANRLVEEVLKPSKVMSAKAAAAVLKRRVKTVRRRVDALKAKGLIVQTAAGIATTPLFGRVVSMP